MTKHNLNCVICQEIKKSISVVGSTFNEIKSSTHKSSPLISYHIQFLQQGGNLLKQFNKYHIKFDPSTNKLDPQITSTQNNEVIVNKETITSYFDIKIRNNTAYHKPCKHIVQITTDIAQLWQDLKPSIKVNGRILYDNRHTPKFLKTSSEHLKQFNISRTIQPRRAFDISASLSLHSSHPCHKYHFAINQHHLETWNYNIRFNQKPEFVTFYKEVNGVTESLNMHTKSSGNEFYTTLHDIPPAKIWAIYSKEAYTTFKKGLI